MSEASSFDAPDPAYDRLHTGVQRLFTRLAGTRLGAPLASFALAGADLAVYTGRVLRDDRVPRTLRGEVLAAAIYIASPIDLIPETLFGPVGLVDDALVAARALDVLLNRVDPGVAREHWPGDRAALEALQAIAGEGRKLFSAGLGQGLRLIARRGLRGAARLLRTSGWVPLRLLEPGGEARPGPA